jgi:hypothetical protein
MRRTTIFRSSRALWLTAVVSAAAAAQQPPATPQQPAATPPPVALPATYVVQQGETLWSLAERFFGDPLLWPEIYRLNTDVIEDPHWIFPGEELRLVAAEPGAGAPGQVAGAQPGITVTPSGDTLRPAPPAVAQDAPTIFSPTLQQTRAPQDAIETQTARAYRAVRDGEYYSAGFLTENQPLPAGRVLGTVQGSSIRRLTSSSSAPLFSEVAVEPPSGEGLARGELLLSYRKTGEIRDYGDVIRPTALLRVTSEGSGGRPAAAQVIRLYGQLTDGQAIIKVAPFTFPQNVRAEEVADGVTGEVVGLRDPRELATLQDVVFINKGADDGVRLGDVFAISGVRSAGAGQGVLQDQARALIVNTRARTASAVLVELYRPDIRPGAVARQVRRMPS